jgi:hypothetical protein
MTDTPPPKRRSWQIHLSTAVVAMIVAAILLYANMRYDKVDSPLEEDSLDGSGTTTLIPNSEYRHGWPSTALRYFYFPEQEAPVHLIRDRQFYRAVAINLISALSIVALLTVLSEYVARRRSKP